MSRYTRILPYNDNPARLFDTISKYLIMEGYTCQQINYENVFKKGNGILSGPTYIKISAAPGQIMLEAWMKYAILPGVYIGEFDLDSFVGAAVKGPLKRRVAQIEAIIMQAGNPAMGQYQAPYPQNQNYNQPQQSNPYTPQSNTYAPRPQNNPHFAQQGNMHIPQNQNGCGSEQQPYPHK